MRGQGASLSRRDSVCLCPPRSSPPPHRALPAALTTLSLPLVVLPHVLSCVPQAESKLDAMELGVLGAWRAEVEVLRDAAQQALAQQRAAEQEAQRAQHELQRTSEVLVVQVEAMQRERQVLHQAAQLAERVAAHAADEQLVVAERRRLGLPC